MTEKQYNRSVSSSVFWSLGNQFGIQIIRIGISAILARLILPEEFGLLAMATVMIGIFNLFKSFGLGSALIQRVKNTSLEINSVFWFTFFFSLILAFLIFFSSSWIAEFYNEPKVAPLVKALSGIFFLSSLNSVPEALMRKKLLFKEFFFRNLAVLLGGAIIAIFLALKGFGVWALIAQSYFSTLFSLIINFKLVRWYPRFVFRFKSLKPYFSFGLPLFGESLMNYFVRNTDSILVGKFLGSEELGYYNRAYGLMTLSIRKVTASISQVMFPALSKFQHDNKLIWTYYAKLIKVTSYVTFPLMLALFILADLVILLLYGKNWYPVIPIFRALAFIGTVQSIGAYIGSVFQAKGETKLLFKLGLVVKPLMLAGIGLGLWKGGLMGMILGYTLTSFFSWLLESYFVTRILDKSLQDYFFLLKNNILVLSFSFFPVLAIIFGLHIQNAWIKIILVMFAVFIYIFLSAKYKLEAYEFLKVKLKTLRPKWGG